MNIYNIYSYLNVASNYIKNLQKYESASETVIEIKEDYENEEFLKIWFEDDEKLKKFNLKRFSDILAEYNHWYKDVNLF